MSRTESEKYCPRCFEAFDVGIDLCPDHNLELIALEGHGEGLEGQVIDNKYQVVDVLGKGGMGTVYLARHMSIGRDVALKVLHNDFLTDPKGVTRFVREARSASMLKSRYSAMLHDFGLAHQGFIYYTMELATGRLLSEIIDRDGGLGLERTMHITADICHSLSEAHAHDLVHRDIKAANIMISTDTDGHEFGKVLDFGTAKATEAVGRPSRVTDPGIVCGTPEYMSPEQAQALKVDGRSDLYSLGILMFEMLTGKLPFSAGNSIAILMKHVNDEPPTPSSVLPTLPSLPGLENLIGRLMAKNPDDRPATALEVLRELRRLLETLARMSGKGSVVDLSADASFTVDAGVEAAFLAATGDTVVFADVPSTAPQQGPGPQPRSQNTMALSPGNLWREKKPKRRDASLDEISSPTAISQVVEVVQFDEKGDLIPAVGAGSDPLEELTTRRRRAEPSAKELSALRSAGDSSVLEESDEFVPLESIGVADGEDEFGELVGTSEKLRELPSAVLKGVEEAAGRARPKESGAANWVFAVGGVAIGAATLLSLYLNGNLDGQSHSARHEGPVVATAHAGDILTAPADVVDVVSVVADVRAQPVDEDVVPDIGSVAALLSEEERALLDRQAAALEMERQAVTEVVTTPDIVDVVSAPDAAAPAADLPVETVDVVEGRDIAVTGAAPVALADVVEKKVAPPLEKEKVEVKGNQEPGPERKVHEKKKTRKIKKTRPDHGSEGGFNLDDLH